MCSQTAASPSIRLREHLRAAGRDQAADRRRGQQPVFGQRERSADPRMGEQRQCAVAARGLASIRPPHGDEPGSELARQRGCIGARRRLRDDDVVAERQRVALDGRAAAGREFEGGEDRCVALGTLVAHEPLEPRGPAGAREPVRERDRHRGRSRLRLASDEDQRHAGCLRARGSTYLVPRGGIELPTLRFSVAAG